MGGEEARKWTLLPKYITHLSIGCTFFRLCYKQIDLFLEQTKWVLKGRIQFAYFMSIDSYVRVSYCFWSSILSELYSSCLGKLCNFGGHLKKTTTTNKPVKKE